MLSSFNFSTRSIPQAPGLTLPLLALVAHTHARTLALTPPSARDALTLPRRDCEGNCRLSVSQRGVAVTVCRRQSRKPHGSDHDATPPLLQYYGLTFAIHSHGGSSQDHNSCRIICRCKK